MFWSQTEPPDEGAASTAGHDDDADERAPPPAPVDEGHDHADAEVAAHTSPQHGDATFLYGAMSPNGDSPSKRAVRLMNLTGGLCADPLHLHSYAAVGNGWRLPTPHSLFVGTFQKCAACHGRLGGRASGAPCCGADDAGGGVAAERGREEEGMLRCAACGTYAHRSCAFVRPGRGGMGKGNGLPLCEVNLAEVRRAAGVWEGSVPAPSSDEESKRASPSEAESKSSWSMFGKRSSTADETTNEGDHSVLAEKQAPAPSEATAAPPAPPGMLQTSFQLLQKTTETTKSIPRASALGMVAGGAAGLALAGPAGIVVGSQIGRTVLAVGAAVEGGVGLSVLVVGLAAAANFNFARPSSLSFEKQRELKLNDSALVLVRPDVEVDPVWGEYADEARKLWTEQTQATSNSSCGSFGLGHVFRSKAGDDERGRRYTKDADIVKADASELPLREKVFLLVARILNDRTSLPGYQYRYLVLKHKRRTMFGDEYGTGDGAEERPVRSCRQDAHGIIKHVTATLLEVRPGLAASPALTELSAGAVEVLVFGELYDDVFGEIVRQTEEKDECLLAKVDALRNRRSDKCDAPSVSPSAIGALRAMTKPHTPTDKLRHCVQFLEFVSAHFSSLFEGKCIDADALLVMVCRHVVAANVAHLHAEVAFVEEFSRDEQLLSGKEGYALITLQAALHYLDSLDELPSDISPTCPDIDGEDR